MKGLSDFSCTYQMGVKQKISEMYTNNINYFLPP